MQLEDNAGQRIKVDVNNERVWQAMCYVEICSRDGWQPPGDELSPIGGRYDGGIERQGWAAHEIGRHSIVKKEVEIMRYAAMASEV